MKITHKAWLDEFLIFFYPIWLKFLDKSIIKNDLQAGLLMGILVIPQSLGYAALAGLPPIMGLYASIFPTLVYALIGASARQAVGPVAVSAIMTAGSLSAFAGQPAYITMASLLSLMVGGILFLASFLRLGWIVELISKGVSTGFVSAAAVLIVISQLKSLIGLPIAGSNSISEILLGLDPSDKLIHLPTAIVGVSCLILLLLSKYFKPFWAFLPSNKIALASRIFVLILIAISIGLVSYFDINTKVLAPLPTLTLPHFELPTFEMIWVLLPKAIVIAFVIFASTGAVSQKLASSSPAGSFEKIYSPNKDLLGLSLANFASGATGGFVVCGGISRTSLNISLGAKSPFASIVCALTILAILLFFAPILTGLPYAVLSAIIISSALSMIDVDTFKKTYQEDFFECLAFSGTFIGVCIFGLNIGLLIGMFISFACLIYRSNRVHIAVVGQVGTSEHFRNIERHNVRTFDGILLIRIDESLYFGNASHIQKKLLNTLAKHPNTSQLVLIMTAVNHIDLTGKQMLEELYFDLKKQHITLHFAEIKGFVMDNLITSQTIKPDSQVFLSTQHAVNVLKG